MSLLLTLDLPLVISGAEEGAWDLVLLLALSLYPFEFLPMLASVLRYLLLVLLVPLDNLLVWGAVCVRIYDLRVP
jgi:hypothetical protein